MQQTAIECIIEKIQKRIDRQSPYIEKYNTSDCRLYLYKILEECMEALEMEKRQITDAYHAGIEDVIPYNYFENTYKCKDNESNS